MYVASLVKINKLTTLIIIEGEEVIKEGGRF